MIGLLLVRLTVKALVIVGMIAVLKWIIVSIAEDFARNLGRTR